MQLIIDINKNDYEYMKNGYVPHSFNMFYAIKNGIPIPDNATNGDVIKVMFADAEVNGETDLTVSFSIDSNTAFTRKWWNAPYQKGGKEC